MEWRESVDCGHGRNTEGDAVGITSIMLENIGRPDFSTVLTTSDNIYPQTESTFQG